MRGRRAGMMVVMTLVAWVLMTLQASSAGAATCLLSAPPTAAIGTPLSITGSDFPSSTTVDITLSVEGSRRDEFAAQADASGQFEINFTPEAADAGITTIVATAGTACSAQVVIAIGVAPATSTPEPAASDTASEGPPPRTDAALDLQRTSGRPSGLWLVAGLLLVIGIAGLIATRPSRNDSSTPSSRSLY